MDTQKITACYVTRLNKYSCTLSFEWDKNGPLIFTEDIGPVYMPEDEIDLQQFIGLTMTEAWRLVDAINAQSLDN